MGREKRRTLGLQAREWASETFNMKRMISDWDDAFSKEISKSKLVDLRGSKGLRVADI